MIELIEYRPEWLKLFEQLREDLVPHVADLTNRIEHIGSTAVPGLPAKPAIDLDVVVETLSHLLIATERLVSLDYIHRNNLSTPDRRAFELAGSSHNLYVCLRMASLFLTMSHFEITCGLIPRMRPNMRR